jgi:epoxyqueuosine reductase
VGDWLFGCDVCQDVCPWNVKFARPTTDAEWGVRAEMAEPELAQFLDSDADAFDRRFGETPFERPGAAGMRRNAAAVLANLQARR